MKAEVTIKAERADDASGLAEDRESKNGGVEEIELPTAIAEEVEAERCGRCDFEVLEECRGVRGSDGGVVENFERCRKQVDLEPFFVRDIMCQKNEPTRGQFERGFQDGSHQNRARVAPVVKQPAGWLGFIGGRGEERNGELLGKSHRRVKILVSHL